MAKAKAILFEEAAPQRISAIIPNSNAPKNVTRADLAFIDAAIQLQRAAQAPLPAGPSIGIDSPVACDPVDVAAAVVAVAVLAYHVYNSCMIGEDISAFKSVQTATRLNLAPSVSLERLVEARNQLADALDAAE